MQAKNRRKQDASAGSAPGTTPRTVTLNAWLMAHPVRLCAILIVLASLRIASTYTVFNHTSDEPAHLACGMEWLDKGTYKIEAQHPPLSRVMAAIGPFMTGSRSQGVQGMLAEGQAILYKSGNYDLTLALARLGALPFFWVACAVVAVWARRSFGALGAVLAVFFFSFLPPVLAHAGLATTDMALTAFLGAAFLTGWLWLEQPTMAGSALFGLSLGMAVLSKLSVVVFMPAVAMAALVWYLAAARPALRRIAAMLWARVLPSCIVAAVAFLVIWAGYRFSYGTSALTNFPVPAPELFNGVDEVMKHNDKGHTSYLLGERSESGFWYYYPIVLAMKTPIPFLALVICGAVLCLKRRRDPACFMPLAFAAAILGVGLFSRINIGVRHILPIYLAMSILAAIASVRLLDLVPANAVAKPMLGIAMLWFVLTSALSHPDYLPYTNALAGDEPEKVLADSDLDWGQDMKRLSNRLRELGAGEASVAGFVAMSYPEHGFPPVRQWFSPVQPSPGWNAVSITYLKVFRLGLLDKYPDARLWPEVVKAKPRERVGKSILLWYFPAAAPPGFVP